MLQGSIFIDNNIFSTLFAISSFEQEQGLMGVPPPTPIMSFLYEQPQYNQFWMHRTPSTLDIVFCNNGKVLNIKKGNPYSTEIIAIPEKSNLIIEMPYGTASNFNIKAGHSVGIIDPKPFELKKIFVQKYKLF